MVAYRRKLALGIRAVFDEDGIVPSASAHRNHRANAGRRDSWNRLDPAQDFLFHTNHAFGFFDLSVGDGDAESLQVGCAGKSGIYVGQGSKSADHQAGANQQNQSQRHLHHDENAAGAMLLPALAHASSTFANARRQAHSRVFEDGNATDQHAGQERGSQSEQQNGPVNPDFVDAGQSRGRHSAQNAQGAIGQP